MDLLAVGGRGQAEPAAVAKELRDRRRAATVEPFWHRYLAQVKAGHPSRAALEAYRWQVEEFRVSVFAQRLGTAGNVSAQRLEAAWQEVLEVHGG